MKCLVCGKDSEWFSYCGACYLKAEKIANDRTVNEGRSVSIVLRQMETKSGN